MNNAYNEIKGLFGKEDFHIHPRPDFREANLIRRYIRELNYFGVKKIGFVEHGIRKSDNHKSILFSESSINDFVNYIHKENEYDCHNIFAGIEVDYIGCDEQYMEYIDMVSMSGIDYVIGSVHGKYEDYNEYLEDTITMLETYKIDILGHFKMKKDIVKYSNIDRIIQLLRDKNIIFEVNIAPRYDTTIENKRYIYNMIKLNNVRISMGSDAHSIDDIKRNYLNLSWKELLS